MNIFGQGSILAEDDGLEAAEFMATPIPWTIYQDTVQSTEGQLSHRRRAIFVVQLLGAHCPSLDAL